MGHILDLLTIRYKLFTLKTKKLPPKLILHRGELVEYRDKWADYYPETNVRWLASKHYWILAVGLLAVIYLVIKFTLFN